MKIRILAVVLAVAALVGVVAGTHEAARLGSSALASRQVTTFPREYAGIVSYNVPKFDQLCQCRPNIAVHYLDIGQAMDMPLSRTILTAGAVPLLELEPVGIPLSKIAAGGEDTWLTAYAREVAKLHAPVVMSFAPEANGNWYSWGYPHVPPATYVSAWRHVVSLFRKAGTRNIRWAWIVNVNFPGSGRLGLLWPGRAYVDILGLDGYFTAPATFAAFFGPTIAAMRALSQSDPLLITETASSPSVGKLTGLRQIISGVSEYGLAGFIWFNVRQSGITIRKQDWLLQDEPAALVLYGHYVQRHAGP